MKKIEGGKRKQGRMRRKKGRGRTKKKKRIDGEEWGGALREREQEGEGSQMGCQTEPSRETGDAGAGGFGREGIRCWTLEHRAPELGSEREREGPM